MRIPLSYNDIDLPALSKILNQFTGRDHQEIVTEFESRFARTIGATGAVAVQSGTSALHMALLLAGVKPGDVIIAPSFCYVAAVSPIFYVQALPILVDADPHSWNLDTELVEQAIEEQVIKGKRVGAIIAVHNYGTASDMKRIIEIANRWDIPVIEDAAESLMTMVEGKYAGTLGHLGVFSFNNNKTVTAFGGGMVVSNDRNLAQRALRLSTHALEKVPYYLHNELGFNYRMSPLTAAYGLAQMAEMDPLLEHRRGIDKQYRGLLEGIGVLFQSGPGNTQAQPWLTACLLPEGSNPEDLRANLALNGIETRRLWNPMHCQPVFNRELTKLRGVSEKLFRLGLCLPMGCRSLPKDFPQEVAHHIKEWVSKR